MSCCSYVVRMERVLFMLVSEQFCLLVTSCKWCSRGGIGRVLLQGKDVQHVQEFKKIARGSGYKEWPLIEEFKRGLSRGIKRKLAEAESSPCTIKE